jgi:HSP20 family protein
MSSMSIWRPVEDLMTLRQAMDQLFEESVVRPRSGQAVSGGEATLPVDVYETDNAFVVEARVPGVNPDDLDITVTEESLTIKGKFALAEDAQERQWLSRELWYGDFARVLTLGSAVDVNKVEASFKNGLLTLTIQKREEIKPKSVKVRIS